MAEILQKYRKQRSAMDIASQLERPPIKSDDTLSKDQPYGKLSDERNSAFKALLTFATSDLAEECRRRADAVNAMSALGRYQKPIVRKMCLAKTARGTTDSSSDASMDLSAKMKAPQDPFPTECAPTQCLFGIGKADMDMDACSKTFRNRDGLKRHFHRKHLRHYPKSQPLSCPH